MKNLSGEIYILSCTPKIKSGSDSKQDGIQMMETTCNPNSLEPIELLMKKSLQQSKQEVEENEKEAKMKQEIHSEDDDDQSLKLEITNPEKKTKALEELGIVHRSKKICKTKSKRKVGRKKKYFYSKKKPKSEGRNCKSVKDKIKKSNSESDEDEDEKVKK